MLCIIIWVLSTVTPNTSTLMVFLRERRGCWLLRSGSCSMTCGPMCDGPVSSSQGTARSLAGAVGGLWVRGTDDSYFQHHTFKWAPSLNVHDTPPPPPTNLEKAWVTYSHLAIAGEGLNEILGSQWARRDQFRRLLPRDRSDQERRSVMPTARFPPPQPPSRTHLCRLLLLSLTSSLLFEASEVSQVSGCILSFLLLCSSHTLSSRTDGLNYLSIMLESYSHFPQSVFNGNFQTY